METLSEILGKIALKIWENCKKKLGGRSLVEENCVTSLSKNLRSPAGRPTLIRVGIAIEL